ncbi:MAG TPA: hypothetical protein GXZ76_08615 [Clostridiaceae bacterium]|nr:hypothetical protein [Clostridiaceae bacterium]
MKTRFNNQLNKKGLTLMETLIAVAIVVILGAIAFIGVQNLVDRNKQTKLDNIAQSMYVSAQNRIRELKASGEIDKLLTNTELVDVVGDSDGKPVDWELDTNDTVQYQNLKYFWHDKNNPTLSTSSDLIDLFFPKGSIDEDVLDDNWVIELDPVTGYVYSAFYSEERSADDFYVSNDDTLDQNVIDDSSIRFKDFRHSLKGYNKAGYYGGKANMPEDANGGKINASLNIINADILQANMTAIVPYVAGDTSTLEFELTVKGKTSEKTVILTPIVNSDIVGLTKKYSASVTLDKLEVDQNFKDTFGDADWQPSGVERSTGALIPGEDLELSFTVSSNDDSIPDTSPIRRTVNSLFASLTTEAEANIAYGRHLQNLDNSTSGLPATAVTSAKQISDIDFSDDSDNTRPVEEQFLWKSLYGNKTFTPIDNSNLNVYSGYIPAPETGSFKILNMHIGNRTDKPAGLFETFAGSEISGITLINEKIEGGTNVGGLAGTATSTSDLTISNVTMDNTKIDSGTDVGGLVGNATSDLTISGVTMDNTKIDSGTDVGGLVGNATSDLTISGVTMDNTKINGSTDVGGLVGVGTAGSNLTISDVTMVNTKIDGGTDVGGLVGKATSDLTIKDCKLYVEKNYFVPRTYKDNILLKGTSNIGGLVGSSTAANLTIEHSFASTIIEGTGSIGGLIGKTSGNASIQDSYADSYLIGGASTSKIGGLAGELAEGSSISGSYSAGFGMIKSGIAEGKIAAAAGFVPNKIASVTNSYSIFNCSELKATDIYSTAPSATTVNNVYYFKSVAKNLVGSSEYNFASNAEAVSGFDGGKFSDDNNENDTYPYNQKTDLDPQPLVTYPYLSITGLPHYGDWKIPPEPEEPDFGKAGFFYWEKVTGGSTPGYQIYMVGRKKVETENVAYEAVFHDTINTVHDDGGIVKEYGYGYYVAKKGDGTQTYNLGKVWSNVNVPANRNTNAESSFNTAYSGYVFTCYSTCTETNPATSYNADVNNYMFMTGNVQNATVTLTPEDEPALSYSFCPFFAKSIKLEGWNNDTQPSLQHEPGMADNKYKIRSLDQLQFINWNSLSRTNNRMTNNGRTSTFGLYYCKYFPYLMSATLPSSIIRNLNNYWFYSPLLPLDGLSNFTTLRARQNFIQDYDIECIGRTGYTPIAALGETSGTIDVTYRIPFFAWFGGSFDGQSYKIKNLSITSGCYSVGVFGLTVSATIRNVVLIRDSKDTVPVIKRPAGSPQGYYAIGTLVGMANEYSTGTYNGGVSPYDYIGIIENCAVAGYEVIDESDQPVSCGETTIGGLAGVLRTQINKCSAVTTIKIHTDRHRGTGVVSLVGIEYEDNITVGGIAGTNQTRIYNCYSGGRVLVDPSLIYTDPDAANGVYKLNIYISGIASSAFTCRAVNMHDIWDNSWGFISPNYYNCYSYMDLPQPVGNVKVAVIGGDAYYNEYVGKPALGGELNNCHYYANNYKTDQMIISDEPGWINNGIYSKSYDDMFLEQFCTDLNGSSSPAPYQKITLVNSSFPCGDASLEGKNYPFPAVIKQEYSGEYVHYGQWPIVRRLELTKADMALDLISYHEDTVTGEYIDDYYDETEVKFYDCGSYPDIVLSNLEIRIDAANDTWVNFDANQPVIIDDKVSVSASVSEIDGTCKLTVTGIDKTELTEILLRYSVEDGYYSEAQLNVDVTAEVNLSANPITPTTVKPGEIVKWNLILTDKNNNLIDSDEITTTGENWDYSSTSNNPADPSTPEADVFNLSITKATPEPDPDPSSPFYLEATAQNAGEADFKVQALRIKVSDENNKDSDGNIRTFDSNIVSDDLHAICYTGKLILKHYNETGTYVFSSYIYNNGGSGINPELLSTDTDQPKSFSALNGEMNDKVATLDPIPVFEGWYIKNESGNHQKLLDTEGNIVSDVENITQDGKFNVNPTEDNPTGDIVLHAMWKISYNPLKLVTASGQLPDPDTKKYLIIAKEPRESGTDSEYYCMNGIVNAWSNSAIAAIKVDLQQDLQTGDYYLTSPVSNNTMLWEVTGNKRHLKIFNNLLNPYLHNTNTNATFGIEWKSVEKTEYDSAKHNLYFSGQKRIVLNGTQTGFKFEQILGSGTGQNQDGGIWLFECDTVPQERLHEFK